MYSGIEMHVSRCVDKGLDGSLAQWTQAQAGTGVGTKAASQILRTSCSHCTYFATCTKAHVPVQSNDIGLVQVAGRWELICDQEEVINMNLQLTIPIRSR